MTANLAVPIASYRWVVDEFLFDFGWRGTTTPHQLILLKLCDSNNYQVWVNQNLVCTMIVECNYSPTLNDMRRWRNNWVTKDTLVKLKSLNQYSC